MGPQLDWIDPEPTLPERKPKAIVRVWSERPNRMPRIFEEVAVYFDDPKTAGMEMLLRAANFGGHISKPTEWEKDMFGIWYATANGRICRFKVEITKWKPQRRRNE